MPYRIELVEQSGNDSHPRLIWEISDEVVRRERLEDKTALASYIVRLLRLIADPQDIGQCAEQAARGQRVSLRVRMAGDPGDSPRNDVELVRLRARNQQLEQQAARHRQDAARLKQENDRLAQQAATAATQTTQATQAERAARQAAAEQVAVAQQRTQALQTQLERTTGEAQIALQETRTLRRRLSEIEDELTQCRRRIAGQTHSTEERRLT